MAKVQLADILEPAVWRDSVIERTTELSRFLQSGVMTNSPALNELASNKGLTFDMPFWHDLTGNTEILSDSASLTPAKIDQAQEKAVKHLRGKAWSANDLPKSVSGSDPVRVIIDGIVEYWNRQMQKEFLIPSIQGIMATALAATHVNDISIEDGDNAVAANLIGSAAVIQTAGLLGDQWDRIIAMSMHSVPFQRLQELNLITFEPLSEQQINVPRFLGREVITDDGMPAVAGSTSGFKYSTYLFGRGALAFGDGGAPSLDESEMFESDRDILAGDDILTSRRHFILHPGGMQFTASPAAVSPSTAELQLGSSWSKAWEDKNIRIVELITNG